MSRALKLSLKSIIESIEKTSPKVHVSDRVDEVSIIHYTPWHLAISVAPVMLNAFHVPLVYKYNDPLVLTLVNRLEDILVFLVHEDFLKFREVYIHTSYVPIHQVLVHAFF